MSDPQYLFGPDEHELLGDELIADLATDPDDLDRDYLRIPGLIAYHGARAARSMGAYQAARAHQERLFGLVQLEQRERMLLEGLKPTESQVEARARVDPRVVEAHRAEIQAAVEQQACRAVCSAMQAKRDMLIQLGAQRRAEMQHDPIIREREVSKRTKND